MGYESSFRSNACPLLRLPEVGKRSKYMTSSISPMSTSFKTELENRVRKQNQDMMPLYAGSIQAFKVPFLI